MNFQLSDGIAVLERTPAAFRALLAGLPDAWTTTNEGADTFSAFDNVGHLIHGERTDWIPRAQIILAQGTPPSASSHSDSYSPHGSPTTSATSRRHRESWRSNIGTQLARGVSTCRCLTAKPRRIR